MEKAVRGEAYTVFPLFLIVMGRAPGSSVIFWKYLRGGLSNNNERGMVSDMISPFSKNRKLKGLGNVKWY